MPSSTSAQMITLTLQPDGIILGQGRMTQRSGASADDLSQKFFPGAGCVAERQMRYP